MKMQNRRGIPRKIFIAVYVLLSRGLPVVTPKKSEAIQMTLIAKQKVDSSRHRNFRVKKTGKFLKSNVLFISAIIES